MTDHKARLAVEGNLHLMCTCGWTESYIAQTHDDVTLDEANRIYHQHLYEDHIHDDRLYRTHKAAVDVLSQLSHGFNDEPTYRVSLHTGNAEKALQDATREGGGSGYPAADATWSVPEPITPLFMTYFDVVHWLTVDAPTIVGKRGVGAHKGDRWTAPDGRIMIATRDGWQEEKRP